MYDDRPIGVFDSGLGGISVLKELKKSIPNENYIYFGDSAFAPYGIKTKEAIIERCINICDTLVQNNVKTIIIACNTATSVAAPILRKKYKDIPIIGMEPAINLATKGNERKNIVVMATNMTLKEAKFNNLLSKCKGNHNVIKIPCPELVTIVEENKICNDKLVVEQLKSYFKDIEVSQLDVIVLGCTHFTFYKEYIKNIFGEHISIIDGNEGTSKNTLRILNKKQIRNYEGNRGNIKFINSQINYDINEKNKISLSEELFSC